MWKGYSADVMVCVVVLVFDCDPETVASSSGVQAASQRRSFWLPDCKRKQNKLQNMIITHIYLL